MNTSAGESERVAKILTGRKHAGLSEAEGRARLMHFYHWSEGDLYETSAEQVDAARVYMEGYLKAQKYANSKQGK